MEDEAARSDTEACIVYLADNICTMHGINTGVDAHSYKYYDDIIDQLGLDEHKVNDLMTEYYSKQENISNMLDYV